ncbi:hypothetical protein SAMN05443545_106338 [Aidingimonas halophila]|uniref:Uncharacterized protein n=1 Tax=Aidingimonas halophila TaxID=574349 RepID=A0A1H3DMX1_9GAMM|nr:hypothetical protein SAMN05443545_106338 [Aidingimonas halophila]
MHDTWELVAVAAKCFLMFHECYFEALEKA